VGEAPPATPAPVKTPIAADYRETDGIQFRSACAGP
jgi:hypothetical protein